MGNHEKALLDWLEEYADVNRHIGSVEQYRSRNGWHRMQMETMKRCTAF